MRNFFKRASVVAIGIGLVVGAAVAASKDEATPEARAYFGFSFGGGKAVPRALHYGLRVDHDSRFNSAEQPPLVQLDYTTRGLNDLRVNGLSAVRQGYRLRQNEEEEIVDEPGFFEGIGNWFGGLFGGDETEEAVEETAEAAEELPPEEVPTAGAFLGYNAIDWGLVAVGAAGLGFVATEVVDAEDKAPAGNGDGGGSDGGGLLGGLLGGLTAPGTGAGAIVLARDPELHKWLDGGTGQMGDLGAAR